MKHLPRSCFLLANFLLLSPVSSQSIDSALAFMPLQIGNRWDYQCVQYGVNHYLLSIEITGDTLFPGSYRYFTFREKNLSTGSSLVYWKRLDSLSGSIYRKDPGYPEFQEDSLRAPQGKTFLFQASSRVFSTTKPDIVLGVSTIVRYYYGPIGSPSYYLSFGLGLTHYYLDDTFGMGADIHSIVYARINGVEHGTPLTVADNPAGITGFSLQQNYPNPFNPSTEFSFTIPSASFVALTIYDPLGKEVALVVNETLGAGIHMRRWNASALAGGVYFYRLQAGTFTKTKKMTLIR